MQPKHFLAAVFILSMFLSVSGQNYPIPVNDTSSGNIYEPIIVNVLQNDYDPDGDSLIISHVGVPYSNGSSYLSSGSATFQDSSLTVTLNYRAGDTVTVVYRICKKSDPYYANIGKLLIKATNRGYNNLTINNVDAMFSSTGNHFRDLSGNCHYFIPKNSTKSTFYSASSWIGGKDAAGNLHIAAECYREYGEDYWCGPISNPASYTQMYDKKWNYIWKLRRSEIEYHKSHWSSAGYVPIQDIASWPGNGNPNWGQALQLAPFFDINHNGYYEPLQGDYPLIRGDECLCFITNDVRDAHTESFGRKLGVELLGMAYAFDCPDDSALNTATFLHYEMINRSDTVYDSTYFGLFADTDLGYSWDDRIQCDVQRGAFFIYNGNMIDGSGLPGEYGAFPPVQAIVGLGGPYLDADNADNPPYDTLSGANCGPAVNGLNFGDGIIDNERYGMTGFMFSINCSGGQLCDPDTASEYYNYLQSKYTDGRPIHYGDSTNPISKFMYPDLSDPCNWGTNGIAPTGFITGAGGSGISLIDSFPGFFYDKRGLLIMGPFTFHPGDKESVDLALVFARNYTDSSAIAAFPILNHYIDSIRKYFVKDYTPCGGNFSAIAEPKPKVNQLNIYPNPVNAVLNVKLSDLKSTSDYFIYDLNGTKLQAGKLHGEKLNELNVSGFANGIYFISVIIKNEVIQRKFVVIR